MFWAFYSMWPTVPGLTQSMAAVLSLLIIVRVPVNVVQDDDVCWREVDAEATRAGRKQEYKYVVVVVELVNQHNSAEDEKASKPRKALDGTWFQSNRLRKACELTCLRLAWCRPFECNDAWGVSSVPRQCPAPWRTDWIGQLGLPVHFDKQHEDAFKPPNVNLWLTRTNDIHKCTKCRSLKVSRIKSQRCGILHWNLVFEWCQLLRQPVELPRIEEETAVQLIGADGWVLLTQTMQLKVRHRLHVLLDQRSICIVVSRLLTEKKKAGILFLMYMNQCFRTNLSWVIN